MEWQDISTAPKNGDHIIVAVTGGPHEPTVCEAYWHVVEGDWWLGATSPADYYSSPIIEIMFGSISHWMPLPPAPKLTVEEAERL